MRRFLPHRLSAPLSPGARRLAGGPAPRVRAPPRSRRGRLRQPRPRSSRERSLRPTSRLAVHPSGQGADRPPHALAQAIPPGALVLAPDASADLHFQLALEYRARAGGARPPSRRDDGLRPRGRPRIASWPGISPAGGACGSLLPKPTDLCGRLLRHFRRRAPPRGGGVVHERPVRRRGRVSRAPLSRHAEHPRSGGAAPAGLRRRRGRLRGRPPGGRRDPRLRLSRSRGRGTSRPPLAAVPLGRPAGEDGLHHRGRGRADDRPVAPRAGRAGGGRVRGGRHPATVALARAGSPVLRVFLPRLDGPPRKRILSLRANPFRMADLGLSRMRAISPCASLGPNRP